MTAAQILLKLWLFCKIFIHISSQCELTAVVTDQLVSGPLRWTQSQSVFSGLPGGLSQSLCSPDLQVSRRSFRLLICSNLLKVVVPTHWQSVFVSMVSRNKVSVFKLTADKHVSGESNHQPCDWLQPAGLLSHRRDFEYKNIQINIKSFSCFNFSQSISNPSCHFTYCISSFHSSTFIW